MKGKKGLHKYQRVQKSKIYLAYLTQSKSNNK